MVVKKDYKTALKYYDKVLKKHPDDLTAAKNAHLAARKMKNLKLEKKYLEMITLIQLPIQGLKRSYTFPAIPKLRQEILLFFAGTDIR